jgi:6-phospho-beta-glucosidase
MMPNYYLQYFYYTDKELASQKKWPPSRAEEVMEIEKDLLREYADPNLTEPPADLMKRGGAYYSTLATQVIESHHNDLGQVHVVNVRNNGAVREWPADWVLELPAGQAGESIRCLRNRCHLRAFGLVSAIKMYELLTVEAAVHGDRTRRIRRCWRTVGPRADKG